MACGRYNPRKWPFQCTRAHRSRVMMLAEIARIDETIADLEDCYPAPDDPIMLAHVQVSTRAEAVAMLRRHRRDLERRLAA